jgi:hypothetical protein
LLPPRVHIGTIADVAGTIVAVATTATAHRCGPIPSMTGTITINIRCVV